MQRIAYYSRACLHAFRARHPFDYGASRGYLQLLRSAFDVDMVQPALNVLRDAGIAFHELDAAGCIAVEPGLRWARPPCCRAGRRWPGAVACGWA